jgi:hypothetical protein
MKISSKRILVTMIGISILEGCSIFSATQNGYDSDRRYTVPTDRHFRDDVTVPRNRSVPVANASSEEQRTIEHLMQRVMFLERQLEALSGYTPRDIRAMRKDPVTTQRQGSSNQSGYDSPTNSGYDQTPVRSDPPRYRPVPVPSYDQKRPVGDYVQDRSAAPTPSRPEPVPQQRLLQSASERAIRPAQPAANIFQVSYSVPVVIPAYEGTGPRYELYYRFSSREQSDTLVSKLQRTHVVTKPFVMDSEYIVQVGSFSAEEPARIRRDYLYAYVGIAPEMRLKKIRQ